jgi:hypothetical protein
MERGDLTGVLVSFGVVRFFELIDTFKNTDMVRYTN